MHVTNLAKRLHMSNVDGEESKHKPLIAIKNEPWDQEQDHLLLHLLAEATGCSVFSVIDEDGSDRVDTGDLISRIEERVGANDVKIRWQELANHFKGRDGKMLHQRWHRLCELNIGSSVAQ